MSKREILRDPVEYAWLFDLTNTKGQPSTSIESIQQTAAHKEPLRTKEEGKIPNLIVTPHCGFYSVESFREMKHKAALTVKEILSGRLIENNCINHKLLPRNFMK